MPLPERVVIDTSAFYALVVDTDEFHGSAVEVYEYLLDQDIELWTTSYALVETMALVHRRFGFSRVAQLLEITESNVRLFLIDSAVHSMAMSEFTSSEGRGLSLVDWTIVIAARIRSAQVFTFDRGIADKSVVVVPRG